MQYYAAVRLLAVATSKPGTSQAARLYRFASCLKLDEKHSLALMRESVKLNKTLGNFKWVGIRQGNSREGHFVLNTTIVCVINYHFVSIVAVRFCLEMCWKCAVSSHLS